MYYYLNITSISQAPPQFVSLHVIPKWLNHILIYSIHLICSIQSNDNRNSHTPALILSHT